MSELAPDLGLAWLEAGHKDKTFAFGRVVFRQLARVGEDLYGFTTKLRTDRPYALSFDFDQRRLDQLLDLIPDDVARWIAKELGGERRAAGLLHLPPMAIGAVARLGVVHENAEERWVPLVVSTFTEASPLATLEFVDG